MQMQDHLFKVCLKRKAQQKILWAEVRKESGRGKDRFRIQDRFKIQGRLADGRRSQAGPDFLSTIYIRMWEGWPRLAEKDAGSEVLEWELIRERREREEERRRRRRSWAPGEVPLFLPTCTPSLMASTDEVWGAGRGFLRSFFLFVRILFPL